MSMKCEIEDYCVWFSGGLLFWMEYEIGVIKVFWNIIEFICVIDFYRFDI